MYEIRIRRWAGTDDIWYGIAWTVTGGLQWANTTQFTCSRRRSHGGADERAT